MTKALGYITEFITALKTFMIQAPGACALKHYGFVINGKWTDFVIS
jgi:hypothetical protein